MTCLDLKLEKEIPFEAIGEVTYWLNFASENIQKVDVNAETGKSVKVWLDVSSQKEIYNPQDIIRKVKLCIDNVLKQNNTDAQTSVLHSFNNSTVKVASDNFQQQAISSGVVKSLGLADVVLGEPLVALIRAVDFRFRELAKKYESKEYMYSNLLPIEYLEKLHHFDSSPQNAMFACHLIEDVDISSQFQDETIKHDGVIPRDKKYLSRSTHVLSPAACYHVYLHLQDSVVHDDIVITTKGVNYRYEGKNAFLLERLWNFSAREIVFMGSPNFVSEKREQMINEILEISKEFQLDGHIENSNDALFIRGNNSELDIDPNPKYELRLNLPYKGTQFSCGSFNVHGNIFSHRNNIRDSNGEFAWSGCAAFGLERWAWAIMAQHGEDSTLWPSKLKNIIDKYL